MLLELSGSVKYVPPRFENSTFLGLFVFFGDRSSIFTMGNGVLAHTGRGVSREIPSNPPNGPVEICV